MRASPWTAAERTRLKSLWRAGEGIIEIAAILRRAPQNVSREARQLGLPQRGSVGHKHKLTSTTKATARDCLCCGKPFRSVGVGNRLCDRCKRDDSATMVDEPASFAWP